MIKYLIQILFFFIVSCGTHKVAVTTTRNQRTTPRKVVNKQDANKNEIKQVEIKQPENIPIVQTDSNTKTEILEATSRVKVTPEVIINYINQYKDIAKENMVKYGVPASIALGQGILESGAGTGTLSMQANNHFGIKCHKQWTGPSVRYNDDAPNECFRKYEKGSESYYDHSLFLTSRPWYASLFKLPKNDYKAWARGLKKSGYATDPKYPEKLISLIEKYDLQKIDAEVLGIVLPIQEEVKVDVVSSSPPISTTETSQIDQENQYIVAKGDTLYSISKKFNITIDDLKRINNLLDNALSLGQSLKIKN